MNCRTLHGVRGLKYAYRVARGTEGRSHPSRGAWIEIHRLPGSNGDATGRTLHGVRGLKFFYDSSGSYVSRSHPSRGAWIEIFTFWKRS